jgi:hypothetical protein
VSCPLRPDSWIHNGAQGAVPIPTVHDELSVESPEEQAEEVVLFVEELLVDGVKPAVGSSSTRGFPVHTASLSSHYLRLMWNSQAYWSYTVFMDEPASVEATGAPSFSADLSPLPNALRHPRPPLYAKEVFASIVGYVINARRL